MEEEKYQNFPEQPRKKPELLTILCILTFIGSGFGAFSFLMITMSYEESMAVLKESHFNLPGIEMFLSANYGFFLTGTILYSTSLLGAIQMWKLRKIGFHLYVIAQILLIFMPMVYIKSYGFPIIDPIITATFIFFYSRNLKYMS